VNLGHTLSAAGRSALRAGALTALVTGARQLQRRARRAQLAQARRRTIGKAALALAVLATAGMIIRNRMA
jgi:hypothetical protein